MCLVSKPSAQITRNVTHVMTNSECNYEQVTQRRGYAHHLARLWTDKDLIREWSRGAVCMHHWTHPRAHMGLYVSVTRSYPSARVLMRS